MASSTRLHRDADSVPTMLARNTACHQCRKRKLKCNGLRPICTNCARPRPSGRKLVVSPEPTQTECTWDEPKHGVPSRIVGGRRRREDDMSDVEEEGVVPGGRRARLNELEEKIASFERVFSAHGLAGNGVLATGVPPRTSPVGHHEGQTPWSGSSDQLFSGTELYTFPIDESRSTVPSDGGRLGGVLDEGTPLQSQSDFGDEGFGGAWPIMRSDWPKELPSVYIVQRIVDVFFDKVATYPKMLRKPVLQQNLRLSSTHSRFPARPLLHAILCITSGHLSPDVLSSRAYWPIGTPLTVLAHPETDADIGKWGSDKHDVTGALHLSGKTAMGNGLDPLTRFQSWHRRQALEGVTIYADRGQQLHRGQQFLQLIQTVILIAATDQLNAWWNDLWQLSAYCIRLAIPLRIYESSKGAPLSDLSGFGEPGCPGVEDPMEQAEMHRTWWMAYLMERTASVWTTWPLVMADDEITCELPVLQSTYDAGYGDLIGVQTLHSADLYSTHTPRHADPLNLLIKAVKLLADAQRFIRFYKRQTHSIKRYLSEPGFRLLVSHVHSFKLSLPADMRKPTACLSEGGSVDRDLLAAVMLVHATTIVLGEPFLSSDMWQHGVARMAQGAIRAILSLVYDVTATSYDLTLLPASISYIFLLASKGLIRLVEAAQQVGDAASASVFRAEIGVFQTALGQYGERFPLGVKHGKMLKDLIAQHDRIASDQQQQGINVNLNPAQALPYSVLCNIGTVDTRSTPQPTDNVITSNTGLIHSGSSSSTGTSKGSVNPSSTTATSVSESTLPDYSNSSDLSSFTFSNPLPFNDEVESQLHHFWEPVPSGKMSFRLPIENGFSFSCG